MSEKLEDAISAISNPYKGKDDAAAHAYDCAIADAHRVFRAMGASAEQQADRQWRAGFLAGWNAGVVGDEAKLKAAQNRVGTLAQYEAALPEPSREVEDVAAVAYTKSAVQAFNEARSQALNVDWYTWQIAWKYAKG